MRASDVTMFVWPSSRRTGTGAGPPAASARSNTKIWPSSLPAASFRDDPRNATAVTSDSSHGIVQAGVAFSKLMAAPRSGQQIAHHRGILGRGPDGPRPDEMLHAGIHAERGVDRREQVRRRNRLLLHVAAV